MRPDKPYHSKGITLEPYLFEQLKQALNQQSAAAALMTPSQIEDQTRLFRERFGPQKLGSLDGESLLQYMHGRQQVVDKCLMYWLEFKDDEEFRGPRFGSIAGGSALKFGVFQRAADGASTCVKASVRKSISADRISVRKRSTRGTWLSVPS